MRLSPSLRSFSDAVTSMGGAKHTSLKLLFSRAAFRVSVKADVSTEHREAGAKLTTRRKSRRQFYQKIGKEPDHGFTGEPAQEQGRNGNAA